MFCVGVCVHECDFVRFYVCVRVCPCMRVWYSRFCACVCVVVSVSLCVYCVGVCFVCERLFVSAFLCYTAVRIQKLTYGNSPLC